MKYFTISELCNSVTAVKFGIDNTPGREVTDSLTALVNNILDPLRERYGKPIKVTSGYRSPKLNRVVRGAPNSQHMVGEAVDITCDDN
ncbi:D-Ala-D-Ala carboxypeptidase family metallohydrolase, partial [Salmonella enterica]|uniref:D-Ala-D-Ala carboxypeptidase family metallohydrolase n=1 Tax=Salmonella enterica TaxID=28901 RepID=UPI003CF25CC9